MFPNARNSIRRWNDHGSSKIPIPIAATLHNLMTESSSGEKKWFRTEHDGNLLPRVRLEIFMEGGEVVYSSESRKSVHPSWEHLDERIDLPGEWWLEESYKSLKLRFTLLQTGINSAAVFLEVPLYPALLHRLNCTPETLPPNSCLVYFSDGSTRLPHNIFQLLFDSNLTEPVSAVEDFSRFEDDAFRVLDQVPHTPSRRERTASSLLEPDDKDLAESSTNLFPQQTELDHAQSVIIPFCDSEQVVIKSDMKKEREFLEAQIAQEEANIEKELDALKMEQNSLVALVQEAKGIEEDIRLVQAEMKSQAGELNQDKFMREAQCIKLVRELRTIYPITLDSQKGYLIRDLRLPVDIYTTTVPEEEISAALGFCCHLLFMMSKYLSVQLRHRIYCNSSRSAVQQDGTSLFPLFTARGVEREQLDRGLTLLGDDVDCILMTYSINYTPKSHILARLKRAYDHIIEGNSTLINKGAVQ